MKRAKISIFGGRHNKTDPINILIDADLLSTNPSCQRIVELFISKSQWKRVIRHMCGIKGCDCGPSHGWEYKTIA